MGRIAQETINRVLDEVDILEVISQYVDLKKRGKNYFGLSPFRSETKPSFSVAADKNMWYDFGSGQGGNAIQFLIEHERIGFAEAVRLLAKKYGIEIIEIGDKEQDNLYDQLYEIHELACIYFENNIKSTKANSGKKYLKERKFSDATIKQYRLGISLDSWDDLLKEVKGKFDEDILKKSGLFSESKKGLVDRFRNRLMFPFFNLSGKIIGFSGRTLSPDDDVKYLNSPETFLFQKSKIFYGAYQTLPNIRKQNFAILVEGQTDYLRLVENGFSNAIATSGTAFSTKHAAVLKKHTNRAILAYDSDDAGVNAAIRASYALLQQGIETRVLFFGNDYDPDDFFQKEKNSKKEFKQLIKTSLHPIAFIVKQKEILKQSATQRSLFVDECLSEIKMVSDSIIRDDLIRKLSNEISIPETEVLNRFKSIKTKIYRPDNAEKSKIQETHYTSLSDKAQLELIKLGLHYPSLVKEISIELFNNALLQNVMKTLIKNIDKNYTISQLLEITGGTPEERNLIAGFAIHSPEKGSQDQILKDCVLILEQEPIKQKIQVLRDKIRRLEDDGSSPEISLVTELTNLQKQLQ
jgi:DNA primase